MDGTSRKGPGEVLMVLVTVPDAAAGERLARALVEERHCACANRLPGVLSLFHWQGAVDRAEEELMILKTTRSGFAALCERVIELHPYDVPEILALPVLDGNPAYLRWVQEECRG